jgi:hypothetical protein
VVRSTEKTIQIPLPANDTAVLSMDASHEDYLFFITRETIGPLEKFFLGRWRKQKLSPTSEP